MKTLADAVTRELSEAITVISSGARNLNSLVLQKILPLAEMAKEDGEITIRPLPLLVLQYQKKHGKKQIK